MKFKNELELENYIRSLIKDKITKINGNIYALKNKKAVDILICRDEQISALFFIEVKYYKKKHGRLSFGSSKGGGFQPEIVLKNPSYFKTNLRWALASEEHPDDGILFVDSDVIRKYVSGGKVGDKFNNIQTRIFNEVEGLCEKDFVNELIEWIKIT